MDLVELKEQVLNVINPVRKKTIGELDALHDISITDDVVNLTIYLEELGGEEEESLKKILVRLVKINLGFKGIKLKFEDLDKKGSIVEKKVRYICIGSGKGGVGKSTVTANLALALTRLGHKVGIIDADIYGPSIPNVLEMEMADVMGNEEGKILPFTTELGIQMMSTEFFTDHESPLMWRGGMLGKMLHHFFYDVLWDDDIEYLLVDLPPGTGDVAIDMKDFIPDAQVIIVTTPHLGAANIAVKAGYGALQLGQKMLGVIENMSYFINPVNGEKEFIFGKGGGPYAAMKLSTKMLGQIPLGQPSGEYHSLYEKDDINGKRYLEIGQKIIDSYKEV